MPQPDNFQDNETVRIEAFSDGVFAIAITLLTFELKAPAFKESYTSVALARAMLHQWPSYIAFLLSFGTIFVLWVNHHRMYNVIRRSDSWFIYYNGALLLFVSLIPFSTNVLARYIQTSATELSAAFFTPVSVRPVRVCGGRLDLAGIFSVMSLLWGSRAALRPAL